MKFMIMFLIVSNSYTEFVQNVKENGKEQRKDIIIAGVNWSQEGVNRLREVKFGIKFY